MKVIGLTGGIGAGKSTVSAYLRKKGYVIIDADAISHHITEKGSPVLEKIRESFGSQVVRSDGSLDRKKLADIVFSDKEKLKLLETLTTREVIKDIEKRLHQIKESGTGGLIFVDAPLLFETGADRLTDYVFMVDADMETRINRVTERDHAERKQVLARIKSQMPSEEKTARSDEVIDNSKGKEELYRQIEALLEKYAETE